MSEKIIVIYPAQCYSKWQPSIERLAPTCYSGPAESSCAQLVRTTWRHMVVALKILSVVHSYTNRWDHTESCLLHQFMADRGDSEYCPQQSCSFAYHNILTVTWRLQRDAFFLCIWDCFMTILFCLQCHSNFPDSCEWSGCPEWPSHEQLGLLCP